MEQKEKKIIESEEKTLKNSTNKIKNQIDEEEEDEAQEMESFVALLQEMKNVRIK